MMGEDSTSSGNIKYKDLTPNVTPPVATTPNIPTGLRAIGLTLKVLDD
jgi:hypothetical protein